jgi:multidrug efflux pump subunit AcrB
MFHYPGASAEDVARLAVDPLQRMIGVIKVVKHVYGAAMRGQGLVTIQFIVGEDLGPSLVKVKDKIDSNLDKVPPGVMQPIVIRPKTIDHVPIVTLTLWSQPGQVDDAELHTLALDVQQQLSQVADTAETFISGGRSRQIQVDVQPERLAGFGVSLDQVAQTIRSANAEQTAGSSESGGTHFSVTTGAFLENADSIARLVIAVRDGIPVYVRDVAKVLDVPAETKQLVGFYTGPAHEGTQEEPLVIGADDGVWVPAPAVTLAIAKKQGSNGVTVANAILKKVEELKGSWIPDNVFVTVTRNYGQTADDKVSALIMKLFIATGVVTLLVLFALGWRPALVVTIVIPVVILMTVFSAYMMGYSINRVSLFALIFSIGILVDDAIVVVENIYRRWLENGTTDTETAVDAVREVGNPTLIATFTVVAALIPMGFVSGMMGPYMEPIPALGSVAMIVSVLAAFIFTPWLVMRFVPSLAVLRKAEEKEHREKEFVGKWYRRLMVPIIEKRSLGWLTLFIIIVLWAASVSLFYTQGVSVKMLPYDNKSEFDVVINMPEGTALPETVNVAQRMSAALLTADKNFVLNNVDEQMGEPGCGANQHVITAMQSYAGTSSPFNFNGLVRHYYLRDKSWQADIQVQLSDKHERKCSSHHIGMIARKILEPIAAEFKAEMTVAEVPPGPPVLQVLVAEIYGPDAKVRREVAQDLTEIFKRSGNHDSQIVDVENYMQTPHKRWRFRVDTEKAIRRGISVDTINRNLGMAMGGAGTVLGDIKTGHRLEPVYIVLQISLANRSQMSRLRDLPIPTKSGTTVPLAELGTFEEIEEDPAIYFKDLRPVEYVVADVVGRLGAPLYGMFQIEDQLKDYTPPGGGELGTYWIGPPESSLQPGFEWTGEWTITYETFRDMGIAFAVALVLIYILVVAEFNNFLLPAVVMAPIPLTMVGIVPGHWVMGAEFTATSMIGFIALAGIIVRNSILLVDFAQQKIMEGMEVREAVIVSAETRMRPIVITAFALVGGAFVIITDPIFQGMAVSLMFGVLVATMLTLVVIPLGCISAANSFERPESAVPNPTGPQGGGYPSGGEFGESDRTGLPGATAMPLPGTRTAAGARAEDGREGGPSATARPRQVAAPKPGNGATREGADSGLKQPAPAAEAARKVRSGADTGPVLRSASAGAGDGAGGAGVASVPRMSKATRILGSEAPENAGRPARPAKPKPRAKAAGHTPSSDPIVPPANAKAAPVATSKAVVDSAVARTDSESGAESQPRSVARPKTKAKPERKAVVQSLETPARKPAKRKPAPKTAARSAKAPPPAESHPPIADSGPGKAAPVSLDEAQLAEKFGLDLSAESEELPQTAKRGKATGHRRGIRPKAGGRARRS